VLKLNPHQVDIRRDGWNPGVTGEGVINAVSRSCLGLGFALAVTWCGGSGNNTKTPANPDSGLVGPGDSDAALAGNPFIPAAIEDVINGIATECEAKKLPASQKPPTAVMVKVLDGFNQPIVVGANRMSTRLASLCAVEAPQDPNADTTAPDALEKAGALQAQYISGYITSRLYKGMAQGLLR
jgi:hypothetical protein